VEYEFNPDMTIITSNIDFSTVTKVILRDIHKMGFGPESLPDKDEKKNSILGIDISGWQDARWENFESEPE
jgi:hypothetical protein